MNINSDRLPVHFRPTTGWLESLLPAEIVVETCLLTSFWLTSFFISFFADKEGTLNTIEIQKDDF